MVRLLVQITLQKISQNVKRILEKLNLVDPNPNRKRVVPLGIKTLVDSMFRFFWHFYVVVFLMNRGD